MAGGVVGLIPLFLLFLFDCFRFGVMRRFSILGVLGVFGVCFILSANVRSYVRKLRPKRILFCK